MGKAAVEEEGGANVTVFDINKSMLDVGKSRAEKLGMDSGLHILDG